MCNRTEDIRWHFKCHPVAFWVLCSRAHLLEEAARSYGRELFVRDQGGSYGPTDPTKNPPSVEERNKFAELVCKETESMTAEEFNLWILDEIYKWIASESSWKEEVIEIADRERAKCHIRLQSN